MGRVQALVAVGPFHEHALLAEPGQLNQPLAGWSYLAFDAAIALKAWAMPAQLLERKDAVVTVDPLHADRRSGRLR